MKKIVITTVAVVATAIAAQAQSPRVEVMMAETGFKTFAPAKSSAKAKVSSDTLRNAMERQLAKKQVQTVQNKKEATTTQTPAAETPSAPTKNSQQEATSVNNSSGFFAWVKAIVLGGPMPGESAESYALRLRAQAWPSSQPYK